MEADNPRARMGGNNPPTIREALAAEYGELALDIETLATRANDAPKRIKGDADLDTIGLLVKDARALAKRADDARKREKDPHLQAGRDVDAFFNGHIDRIRRISDTFQKIADDHTAAKLAEERRRRAEEARKAQEAADREAARAREAEEAGRMATAGRAADRAERLEEKADNAAAAAAAPAADLVRTRTASGTVASARMEVDFEITDYEAIPLNRLRPYFARADIEKAIRSFVRVQKLSANLEGVHVFEKAKASFR